MKGAKSRNSAGSIWAVAGVAALAVGALIAASVWSSQSRVDDTGVVVPAVQSDVALNVNRFTIGNPEAKTELIEYGDYLWPGCANTYQVLEPQLAALVESGELKFTYKDFVLESHKPYAQWAAEAAHCAADQGKFWAYRATLFTNQKQWTKGELKLYAQKLELNTKEFNQCFDSGKHRAAVDNSSKEAVDLNLPGTPSYRINGKDIDLTSFSTIQAFLDFLKSEIASTK